MSYLVSQFYKMGLNLYHRDSKKLLHFLQALNILWIAEILNTKQKAEGKFFYKFIIMIQTAIE